MKDKKNERGEKEINRNPGRRHKNNEEKPIRNDFFFIFFAVAVLYTYSSIRYAYATFMHT